MRNANVERSDADPLPKVQATDDGDQGRKWLVDIALYPLRLATSLGVEERTDPGRWTWDWRRHQPNGERLHEDYIEGLKARARNSDVKAKRELAENGYGWLG